MIDEMKATGTPVPDSTVAPAAPASTAGTPAQVSGQSETTQQSEPYFRYKWEDGRVDEYRTPAELERAYRSGYLRHQDYTKKTQEIAAERKKYEAEQEKIKEAYKKVSDMESRLMPMDKFLRERKDVADYIVQQMKGAKPQDSDENVEAIKREFQEFKSKYEERAKKEEEEQRRKAIFGMMKEKYQDFDEERIAEGINGLLETAPGDEMASLIDTIYWATKGRTTPEEMQKRIVEGIQKKSAMKTPMTSGGQVASGPKVFKNLQEAAEAAKQRYQD